MYLLDWAIVAAYLVYVVWDGVRRTKGGGDTEGFFLANRSLPWWAVGLSVMATQMSAITLVGTTGQAYTDGMRFLQFYYALPLAMIILCVTVVPFFYRAKVFTAYEYLEKRFDVKTRTLTSFFFLISRGLGVGVIIAAPSVILSIILGWNEIVTIFLIGLTTTVYTMFGGVQAVTWTDVKQMILIFFALGVCLFLIVSSFPTGVSMTDGLYLAGSLDKLETINWNFDLSEKYTIWSGVFAALFLFLSYFGCDQSQVQRFLTAKSVSQGRTSLLMSAFLKIPMQFLILLIGIFVFVFYNFQTPPMIFNPNENAKYANNAEYQQLNTDYAAAFEKRKNAATEYGVSQAENAKESYISAHREFAEARKNGVDFIKKENPKFNDVNYVFPMFVVQNLPMGIIGLIIAAIFAAAMSSVSSELNALATASTIDFYKRHLKPNGTDADFIFFGRIATFIWGIFACIVAINVTNLGSLIEVVNKFGSFFYGSLLGVFVLAIVVKRARARGAFFGLLIGITTVFITSFFQIKEDFYYLSLPWISSDFGFTNIFISLSELSRLPNNPGGKPVIEFLWLNLVGCFATVISGYLISLTVKD